MISFKQFITEIFGKPREIGTFKDFVSNKYKEVDSRDSSWQFTLPSLMSKYGFRPINSGKYGYVFGNPSYPYIIKVFMKDTAYLRWLNFAKEHQDNPYVPKIRGKVGRLGSNFMFVRLEKLSGTGEESELYDAMDKGDHYAKQVVDFLEKNDHLLDMHGGNIMRRNNQLVIIDPFYNFFRSGKFSIDPNDVSDFKSILDVRQSLI